MKEESRRLIGTGNRERRKRKGTEVFWAKLLVAGTVSIETDRGKVAVMTVMDVFSVIGIVVIGSSVYFLSVFNKI